ncbi:hypothetical protein ACET3Z_014164 [Daucus carota]
MDGEARYAAATAGDSEAIVDWEKLADLEINYEAIHHTVTKYRDFAHREFITEKLANKELYSSLFANNELRSLQTMNNILFKLNGDDETALHLAAKKGHLEVCDALIDAARILDSRSATDIHPSHPISSCYEFVWHRNRHKETALHLALTNAHLDTAWAIIGESIPRSGRDIKNHLGETPVYLAIKLGYEDIIKPMCESWKDSVPLDGPDDTSTALHTAIINFPREKGKSHLIIELIKSRKRDKMSYSGYEAVFDKTDKRYDTVLSLSVREFQFEVVETILAEDPAYKNGRVRKSKELTSLMSTIPRKPENEYTNMINLLKRSYQARKDSGHENQTALHTAIIKRDEESVLRLLNDNKELVSKADSEQWTPLHYAAYYDFDTILDATHVGYKPEEYQSANETWWVPSPLHVAAKQGHTSTLIKLMDLLPASLYVAADILTRQNILHLAVLANKNEMILHIIKECPEEHIDTMVNQQDVNGDTPLHLLIRDGCFVPELIKHKKVDRTLKNKQLWTSFDMFYFKDRFIAEQVKIKQVLDDFHHDQQWWKFWSRQEPKEPESIVPPSKRSAKDHEFMKAKNSMKKKKWKQMNDELERYRQRTNTQIIVTALITTVTFTVGFTMPGGYYQDDGDLKGMVLLSNKKAFIAFMISDALALLLSTSSLFLYFIATMYEDPYQVAKLNAASTVLNIVSVIAMMLTFITGTYVVLSHSRVLAITVCIIASLFFLLVIGLLIKFRYDRKKEKMHDV